MFSGIGGFRTGLEKAGHKCVGWIEIDKFARKSYEQIYNNEGVWNAKDITKVRSEELPKSDCWTFGFPCQDISLAGNRKGFTDGKRSSLFFRVMGLISELKEEDKPKYLFIENVKNLLSINRGLDFAKLLLEMDKRGYDVEWTVLDSSEVVPQHRERMFIIGHLRTASTTKVFPIERKSGKDSKLDNTNKSIQYFYNGRKHGKYGTTNSLLNVNGICNTLSCMQGGGLIPKVAVPILSPKRMNKKQNGRRYKLNGDPEFTLTVQDRHGVILKDQDGNYEIRELTPRECWRLQGFEDWQYEKAESVNSNSQLYKQAGNAVTVPVIQAIAEKMK